MRWVIDHAIEADAEWIKPIWEPATFWDFGRIWWRYWTSPSVNEHWLVIRPLAFAHFRVRRADAVRVVEEIAVAVAHRRQGIGAYLLHAIGRPVELKTDATNLASNAFYQATGFELLRTIPASRGSDRIMNVYRQ